MGARFRDFIVESLMIWMDKRDFIREGMSEKGFVSEG